MERQGSEEQVGTGGVQFGVEPGGAQLATFSGPGVPGISVAVTFLVESALGSELRLRLPYEGEVTFGG